MTFPRNSFLGLAVALLLAACYPAPVQATRWGVMGKEGAGEGRSSAGVHAYEEGRPTTSGRVAHPITGNP